MVSTATTKLFAGSHDHSFQDAHFETAGNDIYNSPTYNITINGPELFIEPPGSQADPSVRSDRTKRGWSRIFQQIFGFFRSAENRGALVHREIGAQGEIASPMQVQYSVKNAPIQESTQGAVANDLSGKDDKTSPFDHEDSLTQSQNDCLVSSISNLDKKSISHLGGMTSAGIYTRNMLSATKAGLACWHPQPRKPVGETGIVPGDVGTFDLTHGFRRIFNIWDDSLPGAARCRLPPRECTIHLNEFAEGHTIVSGTSSKAWRSPNGSHITGFEFRCQSQQGAVLACTTSADLEALVDIETLREFLVQHAGIIYRHANSVRRIADEDSLYIVSGCIKSDSWALAAYKDPAAAPDDLLTLARRNSNNQVPVYDWIDRGTSEARFGSNSAARESEVYKGKDQCLFLQGFKLALSQKFRAQFRLPVEDGQHHALEYPIRGAPSNGSNRGTASHGSSRDISFRLKSSSMSMPVPVLRGRTRSPFSAQAAVEIPPSPSYYSPEGPTSLSIPRPAFTPHSHAEPMSSSQSFSMEGWQFRSIHDPKPNWAPVDAPISVSSRNDALRHETDSAQYDPTEWDEHTRIEVFSEDSGDPTQFHQFRVDGPTQMSMPPVRAATLSRFSSQAAAEKPPSPSYYGPGHPASLSLRSAHRHSVMQRRVPRVLPEPMAPRTSFLSETKRRKKRGSPQAQITGRKPPKAMAVTQAEKITTQLSSHEPKGMQQLLFNAQPSVSPGNDVNTLHDSARYDPPKWDEGIRVEFSEDRGDASRFDDLPVLPTALPVRGGTHSPFSSHPAAENPLSLSYDEPGDGASSSSYLPFPACGFLSETSSRASRKVSPPFRGLSADDIPRNACMIGIAEPKMMTVNAQPSVSLENDTNTPHDSARYNPPKWDVSTRVRTRHRSEIQGDATQFYEFRDDAIPDSSRLHHSLTHSQPAVSELRHARSALQPQTQGAVKIQPCLSYYYDSRDPALSSSRSQLAAHGHSASSSRVGPPKQMALPTSAQEEAYNPHVKLLSRRSTHFPQPKMVTVNAQPSVSPGNDANALHDSAARYDPPRWGEVEFFSENRRGATQFDDNFPVSSSTPEVPDFFGRRKRLSPISTQSAVEIPPSNLASSLYLPPPVDRRSATSSRVASPVIQPRLSLSDADDFGLGNLHNTSIGIAKPKTMKVNAQPSVSAGNDGVDRPLFSWGMIPAANARRDSDSARYDPPNWDEDTRVKVDSEDRAGVTQPDDFRSDDFLDLSRAPIFHPCDGITELLLKMTGADCALSHDDDWRKRSHEISPWSDDLCFDIITSRTIVARNGVAWLLPRDEDHVEKQELAGNLGTYVPDFHTPPSWSTLDGWGLATPSDLWLMGDYVSPSVGALHPASIAIGATAPLLGGQSSSGLVYDRPLQTGGGGEEGSSDSRAKREREEDDSDKDAPLRKKRDHVEDGTSPRRR